MALTGDKTAAVTKNSGAELAAEWSECCVPALTRRGCGWGARASRESRRGIRAPLMGRAYLLDVADIAGCGLEGC
jgi:hypothetical protein